MPRTPRSELREQDPEKHPQTTVLPRDATLSRPKLPPRMTSVGERLEFERVRREAEPEGIPLIGG